MYNYDPLWKTLKKKKISQYKLINDHGVSCSLLDKLRKNKNIEISTIDHLCQILHCNVQDIVKITRD